MTMKAWFLKADDELWEKAIEIATGPHAHMELQFTDGKFFSSTQELGPRFTDFNELFDTRLNSWDVIEIPGTDQDEAVVRTLAEMIVRQKEITGEAPTYGINHILTDFLPVPIAQNTPGKWICSQSCVYALQAIGLYLGFDPQQVAPHPAYEILKKELPLWGKLRFEVAA